ncbi:DMT family transporter [Tateyamaria sp. SN3-11]|uniref:DMT family transporter n=1 Tax=Tateyamaria sp. SN3-11 TaxID=3092147 RepID=UPI0039E850CF
MACKVMTDRSSIKPKSKIDMTPASYSSAFLLMAFGMLTIPIMDVIAKMLAVNGMPGTQVALARFIGQGVFTLVLLPLAIILVPGIFIGELSIQGKSTLGRFWADLRLAWTKTNLARGVALAGATACFFTGLATLPLPASAAILFLAPLILTLLGGLVLKEHLTFRRVALCVAGFPCVLLIVRPGFDGLGWDAIYPLAAAFLFAIYFLFTRMASGKGSPLSMHFVAAASGTGVLALWLYAGNAVTDSAQITWPTEVSAWMALASLGVISTIAHMAIIVAFARAPASVLAPLNYLEIVSATALSFIVFGTLPDEWTVIGAILIMAIGYAATRAEKKSIRR